MKTIKGREKVTAFEAAFVDHLLTVCVDARKHATDTTYEAVANYFRESFADFKAGAVWGREHPDEALVGLTRKHPYPGEDTKDSWMNLW